MDKKNALDCRQKKYIYEKSINIIYSQQSVYSHLHCKQLENNQYQYLDHLNRIAVRILDRIYNQLTLYYLMMNLTFE